jgi:hypothetical protein
MFEVSQLQDVSFRRIRREQNKVAHELTHLALRSGVSRRSSLDDVPSCIQSALNSDYP